MKKILDFRNRSYSDVSGKYQNMEKPLQHQRRLGLFLAVPFVGLQFVIVTFPDHGHLLLIGNTHISNFDVENIQ